MCGRESPAGDNLLALPNLIDNRPLGVGKCGKQRDQKLAMRVGPEFSHSGCTLYESSRIKLRVEIYLLLVEALLQKPPNDCLVGFAHNLSFFRRIGERHM